MGKNINSKVTANKLKQETNVSLVKVCEMKALSATVVNEIYFKGIMLAALQWVHISVGNGLWEML